MDRSLSDEALTESLKSLIISRNAPVTVAQLQREYEEVEGRKIPELKLQQLLKFNKVFHYLKPQNGQEERYDVRYGARIKPQKKFTGPRVAGRPVIARNRLPSVVATAASANNITATTNNNNIYQKNFNGNPKPIAKLTMPLSERLKRKGELSPEDIKIVIDLESNSDKWYSGQGSSFDKLTKYCQLKNINPPELKFLNNPLTKGGFKCQVTINGKTYNDYNCNEFFATKNEAQEASCKIAIVELKREEDLFRNPIDMSNDYDIAQKIWMMIRSSIGGVFFKHMPNLYVETYMLSLPDNWTQQVVNQFEGQLFKREINAFNEEILFAIGDGSVKGGVQVPLEKSSTTQCIPELVLPFQDKLWNVFVTNAYSPNDICARLIGSDYSDALDKLLNDIEIIMMSKKEKPSKILLNHIYLTSISECWHRVKVVEVSEKKANVICIDNGDYEWISVNDIYVCKPEFLTIAAQAFKVSLFGLEEFENDPNMSQQSLFEPLNYKSLVAEVMTTKEQYKENNSVVKMILYDTSTDDDINLNETLMNSILQTVSAPVLSQKDSNQIIITNIGEDAIYCQLAKSSIHMQQLINNVSKDELAQYRGLYADKSDRKKVYLVYHDQLKNWFRARVDRLTDGDAHWMYLIDNGYKTSVNMRDIYRLDKVSYVLSLYPPQVLKFSLFNVPFTEDTRKRLLGLLPTGRTALAKVVAIGPGNVPQVNLFVYITHNSENIMFNINDQFTKSLGAEIMSNNNAIEPLIKLTRRQLKNNGEFISVFVSLVSSPQGFVIQLQEDLNQLNEIMNDLQKHCNTTGKFKSLSDIQKGECYAVYDDDSQKWIRASVESVIDQHFINCLFVDSGNFKTISLDKLRTLPNKFRTLPKLAMKARLYGVKPKYRDFSPDDAIYFKKLTENKSFPAVIKNVYSSDPYEKQEVYEILLFGKHDKVHETLIKEGRALAN